MQEKASSRGAGRDKKRKNAIEQDSRISGRALARLVEAFLRFPGIGRKSAERLAFAVLGMPKDEAEGIAQAIIELKNSARDCSICHNITEDELCQICKDERRDDQRICVVEEASNILALEKSGVFRGRYHVLKGAISPLDGVGPDNLTIERLMERLSQGAVKEVIIATNPTVTGEATALYLSKLIKPLGIRVTRIAYGLPVGGDIEYADEGTVKRALEGRREM